MRKIKIILFVVVLLLGIFGWITVGYEMGSKKQKTIEIEKVVEVPIDLENPQLIESAIENAALKYQVNPDVLRLIIKCEGGSVWSINDTRDFGLFQINWQTAREMGVKDLKNLIHPVYSADLAAKLLKTKGLTPWKAVRPCIEKGLIELQK
jgi:hypothetical protein